mmetsp:Transcript_69025/g.136820  ORF Transcript_69025/g.136820 Transcript_69025/m.136820 type:complete len:200 (+) Transcript_69025:85-684(+)
MALLVYTGQTTTHARHTAPIRETTSHWTRRHKMLHARWRPSASVGSSATRAALWSTRTRCACHIRQEIHAVHGLWLWIEEGDALRGLSRRRPQWAFDATRCCKRALRITALAATGMRLARKGWASRSGGYAGAAPPPNGADTCLRRSVLFHRFLIALSGRPSSIPEMATHEVGTGSERSRRMMVSSSSLHASRLMRGSI